MQVSIVYTVRYFCNGQSLASPGRWSPSERRYPKTDEWEAVVVLVKRFSNVRRLMDLALGRLEECPFPIDAVSALKNEFVNVVTGVELEARRRLPRRASHRLTYQAAKAVGFPVRNQKVRRKKRPEERLKAVDPWCSCSGSSSTWSSSSVRTLLFLGFVGSFSFFGPVERVFRRVCYVLSVPLVVSFLFSFFYEWLLGKCGILGWLLATDSVSRLGEPTFSLKLPAFLWSMPTLPEHVVALFVEMISEDPVSWEDAVTEGGLRIIRFLAFEEQRILATVDRHKPSHGSIRDACRLESDAPSPRFLLELKQKKRMEKESQTA